MRRHILVASLIVLSAVSLHAQVANRGRTSADTYGISNPLVTAVASKDQVRFTALALTRQIRLEVLSQTGEPVFDSGLQPGNRLEWAVRDEQGSELRDGIYGCFVTIADLHGQLSHRYRHEVPSLAHL